MVCECDVHPFSVLYDCLICTCFVIIDSSDDDDSCNESVEISPKKRVYRGRQMQDMVGKIVCMVVEERKRATNMPVLVVLPSASELDLKTRDHLLVRSFKDNRL